MCIFKVFTKEILGAPITLTLGKRASAVIRPCLELSVDERLCFIDPVSKQLQ